MSLKSPLHHVKHAIAAVKYSCHGLAHTVKTETAFFQETIGLILLPILAWLLGLSTAHIFLVLAAWLGVMVVELLNSAIESVCNLVSPEYHILVKRAKDAGSAAVFLAMLANLCLWAYLACLYLKVL